MEGVSIVSTELLQTLISKIEDLHSKVSEMDKQDKELSAAYLATSQTCKYMNMSRSWVVRTKQHLGCSKKSGTLLFKRASIDEFINSDYFKI
jgi:hypothetical protein